MLDKFADDLKQWREEKGITLQQVAVKTKIDLKKLEALEDGDFAFLPDIYIKAFLKDYAKAIGVSEQMIVSKYEAAKQGKYSEDETSESIPEEKKKESKKLSKKGEPTTEPSPEPVKVEKKVKQTPSFDAVNTIGSMSQDNPNKKIILIASITGGVIILAIILYFLFASNGPSIMRESDYGAESTELNTEESNTGERYEEVDPQQDTNVFMNSVAQDSLTLTITATSNARIRVNPDSTSTEELTIPKDESRTFKADRNFTLLFYNANAVQLNLNNRPVDYRPAQNMEKILLDSTYTYKMLKIYPRKRTNEQPGTTTN